MVQTDGVAKRMIITVMMMMIYLHFNISFLWNLQLTILKNSNLSNPKNIG